MRYCGFIKSRTCKIYVKFYYKVVNDLLDGLKRLEYRGYDSAGLALIIDSKNMFIDKYVGKVQNLVTGIKAQDHICGSATVGMAHTRWATHGAPSVKNAHPHNSSGIAVVHNGIIENHEVLRKALSRKGYNFVSETDTEVVAHLIHYIKSLDTSLPLEKVVSLALSQLRGAFGICVLDEASPDRLIGARRGSPLILGVSDSSLMVASDATALVGKLKQVVYLMENDIVVCNRSNGAYSYDIMNLEVGSLSGQGAISETSDGEEERRHFSNIKKVKPPVLVKRDLIELKMTIDKLEKGGYQHFMLKEIHEQPSVLKDCMRGRISDSFDDIKMSGVEFLSKEFCSAKRLIVCACGTSYHSGLIGEYLIESVAKIPVEVEYASEFRYRNPILFEDDILIVISQSGETADTLECVRIAKEAKCKIFGIVNVVGSSIARNTDAGIYLHLGPEVGVASTKAFTGQVTALILLALDLAIRRKAISLTEFSLFKSELLKIPQLLSRTIESLGKPIGSYDKSVVERMSGHFRYASNFLYLGRGYNYPSALEGALKLKEISYIHAEGYPAAEMKHGPIALIDEFMPVVLIAPKNDRIYEKICSTFEEVYARKGTVLVVTTEGNTDFDDRCEFVLKIPEVRDELYPLLVAVPLQLLAYYVARLRGCEIDQPRNLAKSVTVE